MPMWVSFNPYSSGSAVITFSNFSTSAAGVSFNPYSSGSAVMTLDNETF
ncbi:MAG: hypothetical protein ACOCXB_06040 [Halanaerobium sp.]